MSASSNPDHLEPAVAAPSAGAAIAAPRGSLASHATLIGALTLVSRVLGLARESVAASFFGAGAIWSAFTVAFTIPNLFRKLLGEGALSAAFIPLYAQAVRQDADPAGKSADRLASRDFALASVNLLGIILIAITIVGEIALVLIAWRVRLRADYLLAVKLTAVMLPYVLLVCATALLGAILQVHHRFAAITATSIVLNLCLIVAIVIAARRFDLTTEAGQTRGVYWLSVAVLVAGVAQIAVLLPSLSAVGFRFRPILHFMTPQVRRMLKLTLPVALGAGVLQLGVVLDKGISFLLAGVDGHTHFTALGHCIRYPLLEGAAARLNWAQFLYQFPLGVFAIALATAIFPRLSADAMDRDRGRFRAILRQGIEASLYIGLPASVGMIVVRYPAVRLLFERGNFTPTDTGWVALSTGIYSGAIWAFSLLQILNRAYYAMHDTITPLVWTAINLGLNLVVEIPLLFTPLGEAALPVGTLVSFSLQAIVMTWLLHRRVAGLELRASVRRIGCMVIASAAMWVVCIAVQSLAWWPRGEGKVVQAGQLSMLIVLGAAVYFGVTLALGLGSPLLAMRRSRGRGG